MASGEQKATSQCKVDQVKKVYMYHFIRIVYMDFCDFNTNQRFSSFVKDHFP